MIRKHLWAILALGTLGLAACSDGGPTAPSESATPPSFATTVKRDSTMTGTRSADSPYAVAW